MISAVGVVSARNVHADNYLQAAFVHQGQAQLRMHRPAASQIESNHPKTRPRLGQTPFSLLGWFQIGSHVFSTHALAQNSWVENAIVVKPVENSEADSCGKQRGGHLWKQVKRTAVQINGAEINGKQ